jgi:DNA-directed RNA polymerase subunit RPC12/RpoP
MEKSEAMAVRALGQAEEGQGELVIHGTFKCANCGGEFNKSRSDEEAMAEAKQIFSPAELAPSARDAEGAVIVCDDCFQRFMGWLESNPQMREN